MNYDEKMIQKENELKLQLHAEGCRKSMDFDIYTSKEIFKKNLELEKMSNILAMKEEFEVRKAYQFVEVRKDLNGRLCYSIVRDPQHPGRLQPIIGDEYCSAKKYRVIYPEMQELLVISFRKNGRMVNIHVPINGDSDDSSLLAKRLEACGFRLKVSRRLFREVCDELFSYLNNEAEVAIVPLKSGYTRLENGNWHLALPEEITMEVVKNEDH